MSCEICLRKSGHAKGCDYFSDWADERLSKSDKLLAVTLKLSDLSAEHLGIYPASVDGQYEERTPDMEEWNQVVIEFFKAVIEYRKEP